MRYIFLLFLAVAYSFETSFLSSTSTITDSFIDKIESFFGSKLPIFKKTPPLEPDVYRTEGNK